jgi:hypothetical protein
MISKLLFAILLVGCSDAALSNATPTPTPSKDDTASVQSDEESGDYENAQYRAQRTPPRITKFDANHDGVLQASEVPPRLRQWFANVDANHDNIVTADEIRAWNRAHPHPHHGHGQHGGGQQGGGGQQQQPQPQPQQPQHVSDTTL